LSVALPDVGLHTTVNDDVGSAVGLLSFCSRSCACCDGVPGRAKELTVLPPSTLPAPNAVSRTINQATIADFGCLIAHELTHEC
jgi:hypothetical protein